MKISEIINIIAEEITPESIMKKIEQITHYHRIQGSYEFFKALNYIAQVIEEDSIEYTIHEYPADGELETWGWKAPISWDITSGELWLVKPIRKRLSQFKDVPMSVLTHSIKANFEAEVVDVGKGDKFSDYEKASEKVALITASPRNVFTLAADNNVKGLLLHPNLERAAKIGPSTIRYDGFWPDADNLHKVLAGFSLSHDQALEIQKYMEGKVEVRVHFKINANFRKINGKLQVLDSVILGSEFPNEEVVIIAHLCHPSPGANDNASGSGTLLELVLSLNKLIKSGILLQPKRTIRFLWVPEFSGTVF